MVSGGGGVRVLVAWEPGGGYPAKKASAQGGYYFIYRPLGLLPVSPFGRFTLWDPRGGTKGWCVRLGVRFGLFCLVFVPFLFFLFSLPLCLFSVRRAPSWWSIGGAVGR